jgi:integrase
MRGQRWQDPKIQIRSDVSRPFYFIRPFVPTVTPEGIVRKQKSIPLGFCDEMSMRKAQSKKQEVMATINQGRFMLQSQVPFSQIAKRFLEVRVPQLAASTQEKYRTHIENHIEPAFGKLRMCDIDKPTVEAWLNHKAEPIRVKLKDGTEVEQPRLSWWARQDLRNILSAIFTKAAEWKLWDGPNPCEGASVGKKKVKRAKRIPGADDLMKFLEALPDTAIIGADGARLIVITAVVAGLRVSEVLGLRPCDIKAEAQTLRVERRQHRGDIDDPKSESSRRVRQIGALAQELLRYASGRNADGFIFQRKDGGLIDDRDLQQHVFRPAAEVVGIYYEGFGMHTFRRLNVTWRQEVGATPIEAQKAAGHASLDMTFLYTQTDEAREREHVARILDRLKSTNKLAAMKAEGGLQ